MTAPRMTDGDVDLLERVLSSDSQGAASDLAAEARRARASESALLARVERLEGALSTALEGWRSAVNAGTGMDDQQFAQYLGAQDARAALSEKP